MVDEGDALGEVVPQQAVGVFVAATLLRRSGVAEVDGCSKLVSGGEVAGQLGALVPGDGPHERRKQVLHAPPMRRAASRYQRWADGPVAASGFDVRPV